MTVQLTGHERGEATIEVRAQPRELTQREVVRGETLGVAEHGAGDAERPHGDDRDGERDDLRPLRGA